MLATAPYWGSVRQRLSRALALAARFCFALILALIPLRYRIGFIAHPVPGVFSYYTDFTLFASDAAFGLMMALWLISLALAPHGIRFGPPHVWIPLIGLTLAGWASAAASYDSLISVYQAIRLFGLFWFYVFVINELRSPKWVLIPVGLQIATQSLIALVEFFTQRSVGLQAIGELSLDPRSPGASVVVANGVRLLRAYGLSDHPNILGGCLAFGMVLLFGACLRARRRRLAVWSVFLLALAALLATFSRAAWLALGIGTALIVAGELAGHRRESLHNALRLGLLCLVVAAAFSIAYIPFLGTRLNAGDAFSSPSAEQQSIGERVILAKLAMPILLDHPLLGVGLGASPLALRAYYPSLEVNYAPPHWSLLDAALETGLPGAASYLALAVFPILLYVRRRRDLMASPAATTALALLLAIGVAGLFDYYTWLSQAGRLWQWLAWGLWAGALEGSFG